MRDFIIGTILSAIALGGAFMVYQAVEPLPGYQVGFCKSVYSGNDQKINDCLDLYDEMHKVTGIYDEHGKPVQ